MIRTHRPIGHHWTCASHFQQSKQYRNIDAEAFESSSSKVLVADPDDDLPAHARVAKRRKIEKLADGFLEGKPLFISSASARGPDLSTAVDKLLEEKRMSWDEVLDDAGEDLWADGRDGWDALRRRRKARMASKVSQKRSAKSRQSKKLQDKNHLPDHANAHRSGHDMVELPTKLSTAPSNEALAMAARLRARKETTALGSIAGPGQSTTLPNYVTHSAPPTVKAPSSFKQCSSSKPFNPATPAETTMADELRLSRTESPSHRPRAFTLPAVSFDSDATVEDAFVNPGREEPFLPLQMGEANGNMTEMPTKIHQGPQTRDQESSFNQMNASQVRSNQGQPGKSVIDIEAQDRLYSVTTPVSDQKSRPACLSTNSTRLQNTRMSQESGAKGSHQSPEISPDRQQTILWEKKLSQSSQCSSQSRLTASFKVAKAAYRTAAKSQGGSTPFVYRKKARTSENDQDQPEHAQHSEWAESRLSEAAHATPQSNNQKTHPEVSAVPSSLDMSFQHDSSIAPNLNMALVKEHINRPLPSSPGSTRRSSSVKKSLRREMRLSGADISRAPGEPLSSPVNEHDQDADTISLGYDRSPKSKRRSTGVWPGTQALLNQAQHDFFMSPEKASSAPAVPFSEREEHHGDSTEIQEREEDRRPLRQLSQECLPGTQALMDNWSPWSTAKKSKKRASFVHSPLLSKGMSLSTDLEKKGLRSSIKDLHTAEPRRSSLRFSAFTSETPARQCIMPNNEPQSAKSTHAPIESLQPLDINEPTLEPKSFANVDGSEGDINLNLTNFSFSATGAQPEGDVGASMIDWSSHDKISSFENAQRVSIEPPPETILADLASEYLSTAEIDGVLGTR